MITSHYALFLLSTPRIEYDGVRIKIDTQKAIALLAYIVLTGQTQSRVKLATMFWPESDEVHAQGALRRTISSLKAALANDVLTIKRDTVGLAPDASLWLDVNAVRESFAQPQTHVHSTGELCDACLGALLAGVNLFQQDVTLGRVDSEMLDAWLRPLAESLRAALAHALEQLAGTFCVRGEFDQAITFAERWLALDPLQEEAHRALMRLHAWSGHRTMALRHYVHLVRYLDQELGIAPQDETVQLFAMLKANALPPPNLSLHLTPASSGATPTRESAMFPFIGRVTEWASLNSVYTAIAQDGQVVALEGEGGIGKTRLIDEFALSTRLRGATTIMMRCYEGEMSLAYAPLMTVLQGVMQQPQQRARLAALPAPWLSEVARLVPELAELHDGLVPALPLDSPGAQTRFFESICQALYALSEGVLPTLITCDDAQWVDSASLDLLTYLVRRLDERRICLVLTWRSAEVAVDHPLRRLLREAQRARRGVHLHLTRLNRAEVDDLVHRAGFVERDSADALVERLISESEGLPILLVEYLMALMQGAITADQSDWPLAGGMRDLLHARLVTLDDASRQLLIAAAVIGRSVDFDLLRETSGRGEEEAITAVETLLTHGIFVETHSDTIPNDTSVLTYDFSHEKLRAIVYDEASLARRRLLHRRVAEVLVNHAHAKADGDVLASQIARHYQHAGDTARAAQYFFSAGRHARKVYAHVAALAHFHAALLLDYPDACATYIACGDVQTVLGDYRVALESYTRAGACCLPERHTELAYKVALVRTRQGEWERAQRSIEAALLTIDATNSVAAPRLYATLSLLLYYQGQFDAAASTALLAHEKATEIDDRQTLAQATNLLGIIATEQHQFATAQEFCSASLALAEQLNDAEMLVAALNAAGRLAAAIGDNDQAIALTTRALALCDAQGDRHHAAALQSTLADLLNEVGRLNEAIVHLKLAVSIFYEIGVEAGEVQHEIWRLRTW